MTEARRKAVRWIGWTTGLFVLLLFFALVDLSVPLLFQSRPEFYEGYLLSTGWGVLFTFFVGIPLCVLGARPGSASAALVTAAAATAVLAGALASAQPRHLLITAGLLVPSAAALILQGRETQPFWTVSRIQWPTLALSVVALPAAVVFASDMAAAAREGRDPVDFTYDFDHWPIQAAAALVFPLAAAVLSFRLPGWRAMMFTVAAAAAWFGTVSIVYPDHVGGLGAFGGWASIAWAAALAGAALHSG
ncbi:hypothetical protein AB0284_20325 [Pseudarthrobacter phenanthrenivorans]|uniref:hypothetical protein n=1 Tax=Pseudarthrobacter phenanthrenivorans TaxID=361575 RepID=UPI00344DA774